MDIGATWLSCTLPIKGEEREMLLGTASLEDFYKQKSYMGSTVDRYANRIANGRFSIENQDYQVSTNQAGHSLHGGKEGFDKRRGILSNRAFVLCS